MEGAHLNFFVLLTEYLKAAFALIFKFTVISSTVFDSET